MVYLSFEFSDLEDWQREILIAELDAIGFEGFEEKEKLLIAFIAAENYSEADFNQVITTHSSSFNLSWLKQEIPAQNWNESWEKNFQPIVIDNEIAVVASFHPPFPNIKLEIIINPKMSFGTGHHATTSMMLQLMLKENFNEKSVLDFGCGTGILSILADKLGAASILAVDNDSWAFENAKENFQLNGVKNAEVILGSEAEASGKIFDVILANITREIILNNMENFATTLKQDGMLLISGFLKEDQQKISEQILKKGFHIKNILAENEWIAMTLMMLHQ